MFESDGDLHAINLGRSLGNLLSELSCCIDNNTTDIKKLKKENAALKEQVEQLEEVVKRLCKVVTLPPGGAEYFKSIKLPDQE